MLNSKLILPVALLIALFASPASAQWTKLGGVPGGQFGRIAIDPNNPAIMFVGSEMSGVIYRSVDAGATFKALSVGTLYEGFRGIAVDPANSNIVFALGRDQVNFTQAYLYESMDGGKSWARAAHQPGNGALLYGWNVVFDKAGKTLAIVDSHYGVYRSADLGVTWSNTLAGLGVKSLASDPNDPKTLWAGGRDSTTGNAALWKSGDFGKTWNEAPITFLDKTSYPTFFAIVVLPKSGVILAAWGGSDLTGIVGGVVASQDGGKTWKNSSAGLPSGIFPGDSMAADPSAPTTVYLTTSSFDDPDGLYRSVDSGGHWTALGNAVGGGDGIYTLATRPAGHNLPAAVFGALVDLFRSTDQGATWTRQGGGIKAALVTSVTNDYLGGGGLYASTYDGLFHSTDGGKNWDRIAGWQGVTVPSAFAVDPVSKLHNLFVATTNGFWRSPDAGKTWKSVPLPGHPGTIGYVIADPTKSGRVYAFGNGNTLYRTDDSGASWTKMSVGKPSDTFSAFPAVAVDPTTTGTLYAAVTSGLLKSVDGGATWSNTKVPGGASGGVTAVGIQQTAPHALLAFGQGAMQRSLDGGKSWKPAPNPFTNGAYFATLTPQLGGSNLYASGNGSDGEVTVSRDGGLTWSPVDMSFLATGPDSISANGGHLYVAGGGAVYSRMLPAP